MSDWPEHEKARAVHERSQAIGEFLDFGLPRQGLVLYERVSYACDCRFCARGAGLRSPWHTEEQKATVKDGVVQVEEWVPAYRPIQKILAAYFEIDLAKLDEEKRAMLDALREANARR